jgi:hypothetical protein
MSLPVGWAFYIIFLKKGPGNIGVRKTIFNTKDTILIAIRTQWAQSVKVKMLLNVQKAL